MVDCGSVRVSEEEDRYTVWFLAGSESGLVRTGIVMIIRGFS